MKLKRLITFVLALTLLIGALLCLPATTVYATEELINVALNQTVHATSDSAMQDNSFNAWLLVDGQWGPRKERGDRLGWSTDPSDLLAETTPVDVTVTLDAVYEIHNVILKPLMWEKGASFPCDFELQGSLDGKTFKTLKTVTNQVMEAADDESVEPQSYHIPPTSVRYFRIHITRHHFQTGAGYYQSGIGELELMGCLDLSVASNTALYVNKQALRMQPGEWDKLFLTTHYLNPATIPAVTWSSDDTDVATIDANGKVTAVAYGTTTLRATTDKGVYTCAITVDDYSMQDQLLITSFMSPNKSNLNAHSYDLLKEAGFTNIQNEWNTTVNTTADNLLMAQFAYERGIDITAAHGAWSDGWVLSEDVTYEDLVERALLYSHIPGIGGYYIIDEPARDINRFAPAFRAIKSVAPYADVHLNFLPLFYYGSEVFDKPAEGAYSPIKEYSAMMYDLHQVSGQGYDYMMYDVYPYTFAEKYFNEDVWYENLDVVREVGLKAGTKTGTFILSISSNTYGYHRPTGEEIRFEVYSALAFGYKQLGYFCWQTPVSSHDFGPAIIDIEGNPTEIYEPVKEVNLEALALGPTLMKLDCVTPYIIGPRLNYRRELPDDFFLQPNTAAAKLVISHMRDPQTGEDYAFIVNRNRYAAQTVTLTPAAYIDSMQEVSNQTGKLETVARNADGTYTIELRPGAGRLFKMPATCNYTPNYGKLVVEEGQNMAPLGRITAPNSIGGDGFYIAYMTDGIRESLDHARGWDSTNCPDQKSYVMVDMGEVTKVNRVDLYAEKESRLYFPKDFTIDLSVDGENWKTVVMATDHTPPSASDPVSSFTFARENARYIRINITGMRNIRGEHHARLAEVEIYNMPGGEDNTVETETLPPETTPDPTPDTTPDTSATGTTPETAPAGDNEGCASVGMFPAAVLAAALGIVPLWKKRHDDPDCM